MIKKLKEISFGLNLNFSYPPCSQFAFENFLLFLLTWCWQFKDLVENGIFPTSLLNTPYHISTCKISYLISIICSKTDLCYESCIFQYAVDWVKFGQSSQIQNQVKPLLPFCIRIRKMPLVWSYTLRKLTARSLKFI